MSEKERPEKLILEKIENILHCPICNKPFDFSDHKPIINNKGETQCKNCLILSLQKEKDSKMTINFIILLIIQEINNFDKSKIQKDNIIYLKPGLKRPKSPIISKQHTLPLIALTNIKKNCNPKSMNTKDQTGEDIYTTISIPDEICITNNSSFQDEYNKLFINKNDDNKNTNIICNNNKRITSKSIYRNTNYLHTENLNNKRSTVSNCNMIYTNDTNNQTSLKNRNTVYKNKVINNNRCRTENNSSKTILTLKARNMFSNYVINDDTNKKNKTSSTRNIIGKCFILKRPKVETIQRSTSTNERQSFNIGSHFNYGIKEKIIRFPKNEENDNTFKKRKSAKNTSIKNNNITSN